MLFIHPIFFPALANKDSDDLGPASLRVSALVDKSRGLGKVFYSLGLRRGDFLALYAPNCSNYHPCLFGAWLCGATAAPGDPALTERGVESQLGEVRPKMVVCTRDNMGKIKYATVHNTKNN